MDKNERFHWFDVEMKLQFTTSPDLATSQIRRAFSDAKLVRNLSIGSPGLDSEGYTSVPISFQCKATDRMVAEVVAISPFSKGAYFDSGLKKFSFTSLQQTPSAFGRVVKVVEKARSLLGRSVR